jgi:DNA-binding transcriptional LysR family regulator
VPIQLHRLEGFYWVSRYQGYAEAARNFPYSITQPAVHQQVKKLEAELGCKLFERVAKDRVELTAPGRRLYEFCAPFFEELPAVVRAIRSKETSGELRIGADALALQHVIPGWVRDIASQHPALAIELKEVPELDLESLRTGAADILVGATVQEAPDEVDAVQVGNLNPFLLVPGSQARVLSKKGNRRDADRQPFIGFPPGSPAHDWQLAQLEALDMRIERQLVAAHSDSLLGFVAAGLGFSIVPWRGKSGPEHPEIASQRLKGEAEGLAITALWRPGPGANPAARTAIELAPRARKRS